MQVTGQHSVTENDGVLEKLLSFCSMISFRIWFSWGFICACIFPVTTQNIRSSGLRIVCIFLPLK